MRHPATMLRLRRTLAIVGVGLVASLAGWWTALTADRRDALRELENRAQLHARILEGRFSDLEHPVFAAADFVAADADVNAGDFQRFAEYVAPEHSLILWLGWAPLVTDAQRDAFEATARKLQPEFRILDRTADNTLVRAPRRPEYLPLLSVARFAPGEIPLGIDLANDPTEHRAAQRARDEGRPIATVPDASLDSHPPDEIAAMIAPIYRGGAAPPGTAAARRRAILGYVIAAYRIDAVLSYVTTTVAKPDEQVSFARQPTRIGPGQALAAEPAAIDTVAGGAALPPTVAGEFRVTESLLFSGQKWTATFAFAPQAVAASRSYAPFGWLGAGLLLTAALGTITARSETHRLATERLVSLRTQELSTANRQLRRLADTLEATLDAAPLGIIALDGESRITQWNHGAERLFGYLSTEAIGQPYGCLLVPESQRPAAEELDARVCRGEVVRDADAQRQRRDGVTLDVRIAGNPLRDAAGRLCGIVYAHEDVTAARRLEAELHQAQKMEALGQLTGGLAHDFNNLLGTAIASLDLLRDRMQDSPEEDELAADALDALLHGADLVRRLLAFARRQPLQPESVLLNELVLESVRLLRPLLGDGIEISLDLGGELWPVLVDRAQFETTLINLATNGRDAMPNGGTLTIETRNARVEAEDAGGKAPEVQPGDYVTVEVRDTGLGMPPELLHRIFEPFFTTKPKGAGTGLGLSTVLGFINQSGGHVSASSEPGNGSCFRLYLPRHAVDRGSDQLAPARGQTASERAERSGRILVVEDNASLRRAVVRQLKRLGYAVVEAENAATAYAMLEQGEAVDLMFSDVAMPGGMNGLELATAARARWPALRILLTSGFPEEMVSDRSAIAGFRLLPKPYREEELARTLRDMLGFG